MRRQAAMTAHPLPAPGADPLDGAARGPLAAAGLPHAWGGTDVFVVLEIGFGAGLAFLAALRAWRADPARAARLHWAATLERALTRDALHDALVALRVAPADREPLLARWPCAVGGVHRLPFEDGRVTLSLAVGPARTMVPGWVPRADAMLLSYAADDGLAARLGERPFVAWRAAVAALAPGGAVALAPGPGSPATEALAAAMRAGRHALESAGFAVSQTGHPEPAAAGPGGLPGQAARQDPLDPIYALPALRALRIRGHAVASAFAHGERPAGGRGALVIGAGLAGSAVAFALARRGWSVTRLDAGTPGGSTQPVLAQHPSLTPDDAPLSRLTRAATLLANGPYALDVLRRHGRVQLADPEHAHRVTAGLPHDWAEPVDAAGASERAGVRLLQGGWWLPMAGSADPAALCDAWTVAGVSVRDGASVATLVRTQDGWVALDAEDRVLGECAVVVLACGTDGPDIIDAPGAMPQPLATHFGAAGLQRREGLTTLAEPHPSRMPRCTIGGDGHAVPLDATRLLLGPAGGIDIDDDARTGTSIGDAVAHDDRVAPGKRALHAWSRFASQLAVPGTAPPLAPGRRGQRLSTRDHLPLIGPLPDARALAALAAGQRDDRLPLPILPGLWTATAFGGRGLLWSVLAAELIAARLDGEPSALERSLAGALSPDRFLRKALRRVDIAG
jgi:tRNA 5-methylaminomethyl-2-thiouridine biosynthesis bifunctional protein